MSTKNQTSKVGSVLRRLAQGLYPTWLREKRLLSFREFQDELSLIGLRGKVFGPQDYAEALTTYLKIKIDFTVVRDSKHPDVHRNLVYAGRVAALQYFPSSCRARVWLLESMSQIALSAAIYHELSHLAAGHPLPRGFLDEQGSDPAAPYLRRLARRDPVQDPRLQDQEADLRTQYALAAALMDKFLEGEQAYRLTE